MRRAERARCLAGAGLLAGAALVGGAGACRRRGHRPEDGGAGLAADPHHEGPVRQEIQGEVRQQREARRRLHPLAGLLHPAQRLAHLGREEVPTWRCRTASGSAPSSRAATTCKINDLIDADPEPQGGLQGHAPERRCRPTATYPYKSENYYGFPQMPDVLVNYYRKDIVCNEDEQKNFQAKYNQKLPCTPRRDGRRRLGHVREVRRVLPAQEGRQARRQAAGRRLLRHRLSGRQGLRLRDHAGQRLHLAAWRRHLGRDQGARRPGRRRRELAGGGQGARPLSVG